MLSLSVTRRAYSVIAVKSMDLTIMVHHFSDIDARSGVASGTVEGFLDNRI